MQNVIYARTRNSPRRVYYAIQIYVHTGMYKTHSSLNIINDSCFGRIIRGSVDHTAPQLNYHSNFNNGHPERPQTSGTSGAHNFSHHSCRGVYHRIISGLKHFQARRNSHRTICIRLHTPRNWAFNVEIYETFIEWPKCRSRIKLGGV